MHDMQSRELEAHMAGPKTDFTLFILFFVCVCLFIFIYLFTLLLYKDLNIEQNYTHLALRFIESLAKNKLKKVQCKVSLFIIFLSTI